MAIKLLLADDHPIVRTGLQNAFQRSDEIEVVGAARDGDEALALALALKPDVLLLDLHMPGLKTAQVIQALKGRGHVLKILVLSAYKDAENVLGALRSGADGYILKDEEPSTILGAIQTVMRGRVWLSRDVQDVVVTQAIGPKVDVEMEALSERELQILRLMAEGKSNTEIVEVINIAEGTVKNHISNIYNKLGVHTRSEAVAWAWKHNLV